MKLPELKSAAAVLLDLNHALYIEGAPGIGKSQAIAQLASERGASLIDIRLSMFESVDLRGLPAIVDGETVWLRPGIWPNDDSRESILFFDEMDRASPAVLGAALQIVLDRRIGEHVLPGNVRIAAAGNGKTDRGTTARMPLALRKRFAFLAAEYDAESTRAHFAAIGMHPLLVAFLHFRPALGWAAPKPDEWASPDPRAWEACNAYLGQPDAVRHALIAARVGPDAATEFEAFFRMYNHPEMPRIADILVNPMGAPVPSDPSCQYGVVTALARAATAVNVQNVSAYLDRLPRDIATMGIIDATTRNPSLKETGAYVRWAMANPAVSGASHAVAA